MSSLEKRTLQLGFMPLLDCAPLVVANQLNLFADEGLDVSLQRQNSWATLRDKVNAGLLDAAQMLAPMPLAASLSGDEAQPAQSILCVMSFNGNGLTLSRRVFESLCAYHDADPRILLGGPLDATMLKPIIAARQQSGESALAFASVFPHSCHLLQLRQWLSHGGIDPDNDVYLRVVPPPMMVDALATGAIDGYCVGGPWNAVAVRQGHGVTVATSNDIWPDRPEKVLGATRVWRESYPHTAAALVRAIQRACDWLHNSANRFEAARWLSMPDYVDAPLHCTAPGLIDSCLTMEQGTPRHVEGYYRFSHPEYGNQAVSAQFADILSEMKQAELLPQSVERSELAALLA